MPIFRGPIIESQSHTLGCQGGFAGKGPSHKAWGPKFKSQDPHGGRSELTPSDCSLTFT